MRLRAPPHTRRPAALGAAVPGGGGWSGASRGEPTTAARGADAPSGADAPGAPATDAVLAAVWARVGLEEHASIASFSRFALDLLALGAPAELVAAAHRAALDEVRHATLAFGMPPPTPRRRSGWARSPSPTSP